LLLIALPPFPCDAAEIPKMREVLALDKTNRPMNQTAV
jgi:hypothetical protein